MKLQTGQGFSDGRTHARHDARTNARTDGRTNINHAAIVTTKSSSPQVGSTYKMTH